MPGNLASFARALRNNPTSAEKKLWQGLRRKQTSGFRFPRQVVLAGFIADFVCLETRLVIEVDGATPSTAAELARYAARSRAIAE